MPKPRQTRRRQTRPRQTRRQRTRRRQTRRQRTRRRRTRRRRTRRRRTRRLRTRKAAADKAAAEPRPPRRRPAPTPTPAAARGGSEAARAEGAGTQGRAEGSAGNVRRPVRQHADLGWWAAARWRSWSALGALIASRRRKTTKFEDSIISGTDIKTNTVFGSTGGGVVNTGDNSLASDFSREGLGNIDTDEVDPIAEAEVYLAYGRDAQAEEILKDALKKDPQRQEIYLKLLEIHAQHNKPSAFETVASELYSVCNGQGETWHKAVALGRQLDPNNPMFAEGGVPGAGSGSASARDGGGRGAHRKEGRRARPGIPDGRGDLDLAVVRCRAQVPGRYPRRRRKRAREDREEHGHDGRRRRSRRDRRRGRRDGCGQVRGRNARGEPDRQGRGRAGKLRRRPQIRPRFQARRCREARADGQGSHSNRSWSPVHRKYRRAAWRRN